MDRASAIDPRFTYGDYRRWEGDERWELLDGAAVLMSPAPRLVHQRVISALLGQIEPRLRAGPCEVFAAPFDVRLPRGDEPDAEIRDVVQPDLLVVCDPAKLDDAGCRGAPDWIVEVLSPSTAARDRVEKRHLYERHRVREYWIVDPDARTVTVFRLGDDGRFASPEIHEQPKRLPSRVVRGVEIDFALVFAR